MRKIVRVVTFYDDGTYEESLGNAPTSDADTINEKLERIFRNPGAGTKTKMNVAVYELAKTYYAENRYNYLAKAINSVVAFTNKQQSTIIDKLYRQNDTNAETYRILMQKAIEQGNATELREMLVKKSGKHTHVSDFNLITEYIV